MSVKVYTQGNYFFIEDPILSVPLSDSKGDVDIWLNTDGNYEFKSPLIGHKIYTLSDLVDFDNVSYTLDTWDIFFKNNSGSDSKSTVQANLATNDLGRDAWGRPKTITDFSLFSALWSFSVPNRVWLQYNDTGTGYTEQTSIDNNLVKSTHGHLKVTGNSTTDVYLRSKRHPRYQPNRGLLFSTAVNLFNPTYQGKRDFGLINTTNAIHFELEGDGSDWKMNVVRLTTLAGASSTQRVDITSNIMDLIPSFDPSKGHVYDIQMEWRGVGDFFIYVDLIKVYTFKLLGTLDDLSVSNPALPVSYRCSGASVGNDLEILAGCVDVTSEGGGIQNKEYTSANTGKALLTTTNAGKAILAVRLPTEVTYDGVSVSYTRDMILTSLTTFCKDEAFISFNTARILHVPNLDVLAGWNTNTDSLYEWRDNTDGALDTAFQLDKLNMSELWTTRQEKDISISHSNPDGDSSDVYLTAGDIILVELKSDGNSTGGATFEFAEEV